MTDHSESQSAETLCFTCHPLELLDMFLKELETKSCDGENKLEEILRAADFLVGPSLVEGALNILDAPTTIRLLESPHRSAFLVRGEESYYCSNEIIYCSCRSFLERAKSDPQALCKHLLALKLMPHLDISPVKETVSDADFGTIVMLRVFVD
jgi:predicted nucleic acid-binding Zn finger protein